MIVSRYVPLVLLSAVLAGGLLAPVAAQEATPEAVVEDPAARWPVHVHAGTCDALGEVVFTLQEAGYGLPVLIGDTTTATPGALSAAVVGPDIANAAAVSSTTISATIDQLVASPHAIDVRVDTEDVERRLVCGEIGGFLAGGDLVFGLGERNESGYAGTAWLHDNGDGSTTVAVFLASGLAREAGGGPAADPVAASGAMAGTASGAAEVDVPEAAEVTGVVIEDGGFTTDQLVLTEGVPTILHVVNADDQLYRLEIGDLVSPAAIPARGLAAIEFTTPTAATYQGALVPADGGNPLDTIAVVVSPPEEVLGSSRR